VGQAALDAQTGELLTDFNEGGRGERIMGGLLLSLL